MRLPIARWYHCFSVVSEESRIRNVSSHEGGVCFGACCVSSHATRNMRAIDSRWAGPYLLRGSGRVAGTGVAVHHSPVVVRQARLGFVAVRPAARRARVALGVRRSGLRRTDRPSAGTASSVRDRHRPVPLACGPEYHYYFGQRALFRVYHRSHSSRYKGSAERQPFTSAHFLNTARAAVSTARSHAWLERATSSVFHAASLSAPERADLSALSFPMSWRWLKPSRAALARRFRSTARKPPDGSGSVPRCQPRRCSSPAPRSVRFGLAKSPSR